MGDFWFKISVVLLLMVSSSSLPDGLPSINSNPSERDIMKDMKLFGGRGGGSSRSGGSFGGSRGGSSGGGSRGSYGGGGAGEGSGSGSVPRSNGGGSGSSVGYGSTIPLYGGIAGGRNSGGEDKRHKHSAACKGFNLSLATTLALVAAALGLLQSSFSIQLL